MLRFRLGTLLTVIALLFTFNVFAEDPTPKPAEPPPDDADATLAGSPLLSRLQVHGYLSQAYARAEEHQFLGIPKDGGTTDYREAALQFRYLMTTNDTFVLQLAHERTGDSPIEPKEIELDWGFYERKLGDATTVKIGRVQIPFGIYNEIRDVGTVLPFYRLPMNYYGQDMYSNETVDGVVASHRFASASPWNVEASAYYGGWEVTERRDVVVKSRFRDAVGVQFWLNTPLEGLRFGVGGNHAVNSGGFLPDGVTQGRNTYQASIDGSFERFMVRVEARKVDIEGGMVDNAYMGQVGFRVHPKVMLVAQADTERVEISPMPPFQPGGKFILGRDVAFAVDYFVRPDLVLKAETHRNRHLGIEDETPRWGTLPRANYSILSLSVSF